MKLLERLSRGLKKKACVGLALCSGLYALGCVGPFEQATVFTPSTAHITKGKLNQSLEGKVCVLPSEVNWGQETYQDLASDSLVNALQKYNKENNNQIRVISPSDFLNAVEEKGLCEEYAEMIDYYKKYNLLKGRKVFHDELEIDYFFTPSLLKYKEDEDTRLSIFSLRILKTNTTDVELSAEIWSPERKVWGRTKKVTIAGERLREKPVNLGTVMEYAWGKLLEDLPR